MNSTMLHQDRTSRWMPYVLLGILVSVVFLFTEWQHPYFFLQDDNRAQYLPYYVHNYRAFMNGEIAFFNFHQFMGTAHLANGNAAALYPLSILSVGLSKLIFGHVFAAIDITVYLHMLCGALGFMALFRSLGRSWGASFFSALTWPLVSFFFYIGNSWVIATVAIALLPWMAFAAVRMIQTRQLRYVFVLAGLRVLHFFAGHPQFFVYSVIAEFLFIEGILLHLLKTRSTRKTWIKHQLEYLLSFVCTFFWALPLLLPMNRQMQASIRNERMSWESFQEGSTVLDLWVRGLFKPQDGHIFQSISFIGIVALLLVVLGFIALIVRVVKQRGIDTITWVLLVCVGGMVAVFTWAGNIGPINRLVYELPYLNQFRWPYKLLIQFYFFALLFVGFSWNSLAELLGTRKRVPQLLRHSLIAGLIAVQFLQFVALYPFAPIRAVRIQRGSVPWKEPLVDELQDGRIISLGFNYTEEYTAHTLAFAYATLWGLDNYSGYDAMVTHRNLEPQGGFGLYSGYYNDILTEQNTLAERLEEFRAAGVRYYVVNPAYIETYGAPDPSWKLMESSERRVVYEDPLAWPIIHAADRPWESIGQVERTANTLTFRYTLAEPAELLLSVIPQEHYHLSIDGEHVAWREVDGRLAIASDAGEHVLELRYIDYEFRQGMFYALAFTVLLAVVISIIRLLPASDPK